MANVLVRKSLEQIRKQSLESEKGLKRTLGATNLVLLGIGAIIGAGIFVLTGNAAAVHAGPAIVISFVLAAVVCLFAGLCYAEMASAVPIAGSAYTYAYATMGEIVAWIIGWDLILEYMLGATTVAIGWSGYLISLLNDLGIYFPIEWTASPGVSFVNLPSEIAQKFHLDAGWHQLGSVRQVALDAGLDLTTFQMAHGIANLPAMFIVLFVSTILCFGIQQSAFINNLIVLLKVGIVLIFVAVGLPHVDTANWGGQFIPNNTGVFGEYGWSGILRGAGLVFFSYIGFDAVSTTAQEAKNPQRDLPIGILGSLIVCTILYILVAFVLTGVVNYKLLNVAEPIAVGIDAIGSTWLSPFIKLGALAGLSSVILVLLLGQTRIFFAMAFDGLLPEIAGRINQRFRTPVYSTLFTGFICVLLAGFSPIHIVGELVSIGTLFAFVVVCVGVLLLRKIDPNLRRDFKVPYVRIVAPIGAGTAMFLMLGLPLETWIRLFIWLAIGLFIYVFYGMKRSKIQKGEI